jgi:hypothetical protein
MSDSTHDPKNECNKQMNRRELLSIAGASAGAAAAAGMGLNPNVLHAQDSEVATELLPFEQKRELPYGMIGDVKISRMMLGGNLIGGWMHARDLKYVGSLFRAYATEDKIIETLRIADENGINTVFETGATHIARYNREYGRNMQFIPHIEVNINQNEDDLKKHIESTVETGAAALYVWGISGDKLIQAGAVDQLSRAVEIAKTFGLPVGVGSHSLLVTKACEENDVPCDFYVKTLHEDDYPSATPKEDREEFMWFGGEHFYDNMWCINPEETVAYMETVEKPWVAFKILAAGAYLPMHGFPYAFKSGADFIAVGMFDFQIEQNCQMIPRLVEREQRRTRPWRA